MGPYAKSNWNELARFTNLSDVVLGHLSGFMRDSFLDIVGMFDTVALLHNDLFGSAEHRIDSQGMAVMHRHPSSHYALA